MPIYKGSTKLGTIYHGSTKIEKVYRGSTLVYSGQLSVYNIYSTNQEQDGNCGFFLGEPGANKTLAGGGVTVHPTKFIDWCNRNHKQYQWYSRHSRFFFIYNICRWKSRTFWIFGEL